MSSLAVEIAAELITADWIEGFSATPYKCPAGVMTIGYGTTDKEAIRKGRLTKAEALEYVYRDLEGAEKVLNASCKVPLDEFQRAALISFIYNVGPGKKDVKDGFVTLKSGEPSTMLRRLREKNYAEAHRQFGFWVKANGRVQPGLVKRRLKESHLFALRMP